MGRKNCHENVILYEVRLAPGGIVRIQRSGREPGTSAMLATVAARFVPMGSSRSRDMSSCLWRIAIWPVTRSPERRQARMFIHVTCFKATSYVTHFKSALSFGEGHASRGILRNHGRNNNSPATPRRNAYTTESSETRVPDT